MTSAIGLLDWASIGAGVANHLWQSTLFVGVAWLLTLALRKNHASIRHWIWLTASLKFLLPFSLLIALGSYLGWKTPPVIAEPQWSVIEDISQPFAVPALTATAPLATRSADSRIELGPIVLAVWFVGFAAVVLYGIIRWRSLTAFLGKANPLVEGREIDALQRVRLLRDWPSGVNLATSISTIEPGVRGIIHPVLLLPVGIADRLNNEQLDTIIAHELSHIRRRDNLAAAIHMAVETTFWFHPLVWWIGSRLVDERERACDEDVLQIGSDPQVYAGAILKVCEFHLTSPLTLVSGVTGSNLTKRIETLMVNRAILKLSFSRTLLLAAAGIATVSVPVLYGATHRQHDGQSGTAASPSFEAAVIKSSETDVPWVTLPSGTTMPVGQIPGCRGIDTRGFLSIPLNRCVSRGYSLQWVIALAYRVPWEQRNTMITGGPDWLHSVRFDIEAKAESPTSEGPLYAMLQELLAEKFKLKFHREKREIPVLALVVAKGGPKFVTAPKDRNCAAEAGGGCGMGAGIGGFSGTSQNMTDFANTLSLWARAVVVDRTGLLDRYDFKTGPWRPENPGPNFAAETHGDPETFPTIFAVLQEQLGLQLVAQKAEIEIIVIDSVEKPPENVEAAISEKPRGADLRAKTAPVQAAPTSTGSRLSKSVTASAFEFEVASIKPNESGNPRMTIGGPGGCHGTDDHNQSGLALGRCAFRNMSTKELMQLVYGVLLQRGPRFSGEPAWVTSYRFDIEAKAEGPVTQGQLLLMMKALLETRFKLALHSETQQVPGYALVIGKNGSKLRQAEDNGEGQRIFRATTAPDSIRLTAQGASLSRLAAFLEGMDNPIGARFGVGRPVLDRTGLNGNFDFALEWSSEFSSSSDSLKPSIFTAVQEQLGLRLDPQTIPLDVLVIDHIEKPTAN